MSGHYSQIEIIPYKNSHEMFSMSCLINVAEVPQLNFDLPKFENMCHIRHDSTFQINFSVNLT